MRRKPAGFLPHETGPMTTLLTVFKAAALVAGTTALAGLVVLLGMLWLLHHPVD